MSKTKMDFVANNDSTIIAAMAITFLVLSILTPQAFERIRYWVGISHSGSNHTQLLREALEKNPPSRLHL